MQSRGSAIHWTVVAISSHSCQTFSTGLCIHPPLYLVKYVGKGKGKGSPWHLVQLCPTLGRGAHPHLQAIEPAFCPKTVSMVTWLAWLDTERCYLPTKVVLIYLLAFARFQTTRLAGAGTSDRSSPHPVDSILRLLAFWPCSIEASVV